MKELKGSRTYDNLMMAFAGETQARTKYSIFASKAKEEGYHQIGRIFEETADNERGTRRYGSGIWRAWAIQLKTWCQQQRASIMNGAACMPIWRRLHARKALQR